MKPGAKVANDGCQTTDMCAHAEVLLPSAELATQLSRGKAWHAPPPCEWLLTPPVVCDMGIQGWMPAHC